MPPADVRIGCGAWRFTRALGDVSDRDDADEFARSSAHGHAADPKRGHACEDAVDFFVIAAGMNRGAHQAEDRAAGVNAADEHFHGNVAIGYHAYDRAMVDHRQDADVPVDDHGSATRSAILLDMLLAQVKPAQALVIRLVKLNGASVEEASRITGQSASLVKVNIHRGLKRIGQALDSCRDGSPSL